jgi:GTP-binding protein
MALNVTKTKKLSNMRSAGADEKMVLAPPVKMSLEQAMEYVGKDEYVEVTPQHIRLRKILLKETERKRAK